MATTDTNWSNSMIIPDTFKEAVIMMDSEVAPAMQSRLRSLIRDAAGKVAGILIEEGGPEKSDFQARKEQVALDFCKHFSRNVREAWYRQRLLQFDLNLYLLLRDTLTNRAHVIIGQAIDAHAPHKQEATKNVASWTSHFTPSELTAITAHCRPEKLSRTCIDEAYLDMMWTLTCLWSAQIVFISLSPADLAKDQIESRFFSGFVATLEAVDHDMAAAMKLIKDALETRAAYLEDRDSSGAVEERPDLLNARLPGWVLTNAASWPKVLIQLRERVPLDLQSDPLALPETTPESWEWLCKDGGLLLICWGQFQVAQPGVFAESRTRQLSAIAACLDDESQNAAYEFAGFGPSGRAVACKAINILLNAPHASSHRPFDKGGLQTFGKAQFLLPASPLLSNEHIEKLEEQGFSQVLRWVSDKVDHPVVRGLEAFETARSLGARYGSVPRAVEQGWRLAALCTCLERLFSVDKREHWVKIREAVRGLLGNTESSLIQSAYDRRNDQVHENVAQEWPDFVGFADVVRRVLAIELRRAAGLP